MPDMKIAFTPCVFHFSMKLSSCDWACVVSPPLLIDKIAVEPVFTPSFFRPGSMEFVITAFTLVSPSTATVLPSSVPCFLSRSSRMPTDRSGMLPGVTMYPGGERSMIACVRSNVTRSRFCSFEKQRGALPSGS